MNTLQPLVRIGAGRLGDQAAAGLSQPLRRAVLITSISVILFFTIFGGMPGMAHAQHQFHSAATWGNGPLAEKQRSIDTLVLARKTHGAQIDSLFAKAGIPYPGRIFLRAFKAEMVLELWAWDTLTGKYVKLKDYRFNGTSGVAGPKRKEFDGQIPEGFYHVAVLNPQSSYHLSFGLDYPNLSDRQLGDQEKPGGEIYIHGGGASVGCIPLGDPAIEELYLIVLDSRDVGLEVPVHIFPWRMSDPARQESYDLWTRQDSTLIPFWANLREGYDWFETKQTLPKITVDKRGKYLFKGLK